MYERFAKSSNCHEYFGLILDGYVRSEFTTIVIHERKLFLKGSKSLVGCLAQKKYHLLSPRAAGVK